MKAESSGIGAYLQELRTAKGVTTADLALRANLRRATLSDWQNGKRVPRLPELEMVLTALEASEPQRCRALDLIKAPRAVQKLRGQAAKSEQELIDLAGHLPHGGDLLRALRLRKGWTQAQIAAAIAVQQTSIARWERSEIWPSPERLHALCYALDAHEAEIVALTSGRFSLADGRGTPTEETIAADLHRVVRAPNPPQKTALNELSLLTLAAQAWSLARESASARCLLANIYTTYSDRLYLQRRFSECKKIALRALDIYAHLGYISLGGLRAVSRAAEAIAQEGGCQNLRHAIEILQIWLPQAGHPVHSSWMMSDMGRFYAQLGYASDAIECGREGYRLIADYPNPGDRLFRRQDLAEILALTGTPDRAEEYVVTETEMSYILISRARIHRRLKDRATVHHLLDTVRSQQEDFYMGFLEHPFYQGETEKVADSLLH